jgi:hypothetical protein
VAHHRIIIATGVLTALWATAIINVMVLSFLGISDDPILISNPNIVICAVLTQLSKFPSWWTGLY